MRRNLKFSRVDTTTEGIPVAMYGSFGTGCPTVKHVENNKKQEKELNIAIGGCTVHSSEAVPLAFESPIWAELRIKNPL